MYSIKQASLRSGVSVPLIRAWERRYGVVVPRRTPSGYRLYDDEAIGTLIRVRELTEEGWSASQASEAILSGQAPLRASAPQEPIEPQERVVGAHRRDLVERFVASATDMDGAATGAVIDEMFALGSFESVVDDLVMPALVELGQAWSDGRLDVAAEHAASAAVYRRLSALYEAAAVGGAPSVVVGLPPGARHELGALAFSVALRRLGVAVLYLGPDVPVASWVHVVGRELSRVAVIGVAQQADRTATLEVAAAIRAGGHPPIVAVGGRHARWEAAETAGITILPGRVSEAARVVAALAAGAVAGSERAREEGSLRSPTG
jgi:DNA-binding transcriptional MerR regulator/methylmalonyl-CoA mutase cobalamin-binding subunit